MNKRKHKPITIETLKSALAESTSCLAAAKSLGLPGYYVSVTCSTLGLKATGKKKDKIVDIFKKTVTQHKINKAIEKLRAGLTLDEASIFIRVPYLTLRAAMRAQQLPTTPAAVRAWDLKAANEKAAA